MIVPVSKTVNSSQRQTQSRTVSKVITASSFTGIHNPDTIRDFLKLSIFKVLGLVFKELIINQGPDLTKMQQRVFFFMRYMAMKLKS